MAGMAARAVSSDSSVLEWADFNADAYVEAYRRGGHRHERARVGELAASPTAGVGGAGAYRWRHALRLRLVCAYFIASLIAEVITLILSAYRA